ncbi:TetR/AcrR family transcriptional regulator [Streptomyces botrytidirepellens]|uniref:TetR family transcriptional regulator n=1 Tax=Streptomyces botrytidirepellens TaxID=2486417 RepID=A0A3M8UYT0_9ACTN|nr:TetR family transcriptional regulator [Streptomyces botrytidirepellens]RNG10596.1 TetR family transcriptional regulator [Streptomyces botrytidirepellens]
MGRRYDPERRQRIIDAAIAVVGERGIGALSHRAVAAEADVPLGSTTYHFATLDDLLVAALEQVNTECLADVERMERDAPPGMPLADQMAWLMEQMLTGDRKRLELEYELYLVGLRRASVRPIAASFLDRMAALLERRTGDPDVARAVNALFDGMLLQILLTGRAFDREEARAAFARVTG